MFQATAALKNRRNNFRRLPTRAALCVFKAIFVTFLSDCEATEVLALPERRAVQLDSCIQVVPFQVV
ncbi:unnamed protein product [Dracunculus medinensis]|uniref:Secreted protein n=1 Tax=Dracunculus medinensis TaxID=318479 RepID=A0A0N4UF35_DRAME|nr:unnamed protein product [Dracunculus medinensis]